MMLSIFYGMLSFTLLCCTFGIVKIYAFFWVNIFSLKFFLLKKHFASLMGELFVNVVASKLKPDRRGKCFKILYILKSNGFSNCITIPKVWAM